MKIKSNELASAKICIVGIGGCGGNIVNSIVASTINIKTIVVNTDSQAINDSIADVSIVCGENITKGMGAGANPSVGRDSVATVKSDIEEIVRGYDLVFVVGGMGGGTGTYGIPLISAAIKDIGISVISVITMPFLFEGSKRMAQANNGLLETIEASDTIIKISNQDLVSKYRDKKIKFSDAFIETDDIIRGSIKSFIDIVSGSSRMNIDFADIRTVISSGGRSEVSFHHSKLSGDVAIPEFISNSVGDASNIGCASAAIVSISMSSTVEFSVVSRMAEELYSKMNSDANIIFDASISDSLDDDEVSLSIIASGIQDAEEGRDTFYHMRPINNT